MSAPKPPVSENEEARLEALRSYDILDTLSEQEFDQLSTRFETAPRVRSFQRFVPLIVFLGLMFVTAVVAAHMRGLAEQNREQRFREESEWIEQAITARLASYEELTRSAAAYFNGSESISRDEWRRYIEALGLEKNNPGITGFGFVESIRASDVDDFLARKEMDGNGFRLKPPGSRDRYYPVSLIEPEARNLAALGYDIATETERQFAADLARDRGTPMLSGKVALLQDVEKKPGFLLLYPVYEIDRPLATVDERRAAIRGWIYLASRVEDLIATLPYVRQDQVAFRVIDAASGAPLFMGSDHNLAKSTLTRSTVLPIYGRHWRITTTPRGELARGKGFAVASSVAAAGTAISLLVSAIIWSFSTRREQAQRLATKMTQTLRQREEGIRAIVDNVAEGIISLDEALRIQTFNPASEQIFGYSPSQVMRKHIQEIFPALRPEDLDGREVLLEARTAKGETIVVALTASSIAGAAQAFVLVARDVTEKTRAEEALRKSETLKRSIINNMFGGLITVDQNGTIESVNPAAERIFGYPTEELVGQNVTLLLPREPEEPEQFLAKARTSALDRVTVWEGRRKNGDIFPFELTLFEFEGPDRRLLAGNVHDISERQEVERMKKEFVSTVSHELRTPLTSIQGSLDLVAGGVFGVLPEKAGEMIQIARRNSSRLIRLINDILDLDRLDAGRMDMHFTNTPVNALFEKAIQSVSSFAEKENITLSIASAEGSIFADDHRIVQVLVNFVSNAIKFSPAGSEVTLRSLNAGTHWQLQVEDRGRGVPAQLQGRIFERFQQVDASDSRAKGGTGLGLAICKAIAEQHGGTIGVDSTEGSGSTFWIRIPAAIDESADVLIVEDDSDLRRVLSEQLQNVGITSRDASSIQEGIAAAERQKPRLIILDLTLPDGDGTDLVKKFRNDPRFRTVPLVVFSATELDSEQREMLRLGPTRHLVKGRKRDIDVVSAVLDLLPGN